MTNERRLIRILKSLKHEGEAASPPDKIGISPAQVNIIDEISIAGKITIKELSENLNLTPPTISAGVKKLEKNKLIKRESHKEDGRSILLTLPKEGKNLHNRIEDYRNTRVRKILNRLNSDDQNKMLSLLEIAIKKD
ncbi:MAG: MarR family transcriptional regulator [Spirochaetota bacterium]|nr:MarR family transcriptional regulator [Spirochaetota bacterium]